MSANAEVLGATGRAESSPGERAKSKTVAAREAEKWDPSEFAREQIQGLVQRVFFANEVATLRQVLFTAAEPGLAVGTVCDQVAQALARETTADVALLDRPGQLEDAGTAVPRSNSVYSTRSSSIKCLSTQMANNLWRVPPEVLKGCNPGSGVGLRWLSCLAELRNEFEYTVIHGPVAAVSTETALAGAMTDGIILVIGAHSTRKATVKKIKQTLELSHSRILGTVLSERTFPIPERIYRRL